MSSVAIKIDDAALIKKIKEVTEQNMTKACMSIYADAVRLCETDTGRLKGSLSWAISTQRENRARVAVKMYSSSKHPGKIQYGKETDGVEKPKAVKDEIIGVVGSNVEYALYQELGTSRMNGKPYLMPALHNNKEVILRLFNGGLD